MYQLDANNFTIIFFGHLHIHLQEFLYIGCFTTACGVMPCEKT